MRKLFIAALVLIVSVPASSASTVVLKSGKTVVGEMVERTEKYVKIDYDGIPLTYYMDEVKSIDGEKPVQAVGQSEAPAADIPKKIEPDEALEEEPSEEDAPEPSPIAEQEQVEGSVEAAKPEPLKDELAQETGEERGSGVPLRELPFSTAIITYKVSGNVTKGEEVAYIDAERGMVAHESRGESVMKDFDQSTATRTVCDGKKVYHIDLKEMVIIEGDVESGDAIFNTFNEEGWKEYYKKEKKHMGKKCKVYNTGEGQEVYFWHGILLKTVTRLELLGVKANTTVEAVDIQLNVPIPEEKFEIPEGFTVKSSEEVWEELGEMIQQIQKEERSRKSRLPPWQR